MSEGIRKSYKYPEFQRLFLTLFSIEYIANSWQTTAKRTTSRQQTYIEQQYNNKNKETKLRNIMKDTSFLNQIWKR